MIQASPVWLWISVMGIGCLLLMFRGAQNTAPHYQFPFLAASVFAGFILVQLIGLANRGMVPGAYLAKAAFLGCLCLAAIWAGDLAGRRSNMTMHQYGFGRVSVLALVLSLVGLYFLYQITLLPRALTSGVWTGLPTIYVFFYKLAFLGFGVALLVWVRTGSTFVGALALIDFVVIAGRALTLGRRADLFEVLAISAVALYFGRGVLVPRAFALAAMVLGTLFLHSAGDYRYHVISRSESPWQAMSNVAFVKNIDSILQVGGFEVQNAAMEIAAVDLRGDFDFGAFHWNQLVFAFVPGQFLGKEVKESLYLPIASNAYDAFGYVPRFGTTMTGLADAFRSFWFFGAVKFFLISAIMARYWKSARAGNFLAQLAFLSLITAALHTITHHTQWFFTAWLSFQVFVGVWLVFCRVSIDQRAGDVIDGVGVAAGSSRIGAATMVAARRTPPQVER